MSKLNHQVKILEIEKLTHDVYRFALERPENFHFTSGEAVELTVNEPKFLTDAAPFTLTGRDSDDTLELIFKVYASHNGMTLAMSKQEVGNTLFIGHPWKAFEYKQPGTFIAGGTGLSAFLPILRYLADTGQIAGNKLIFANKTSEDIFLEDELSQLLGHNFINIVSRERSQFYYNGRVKAEFLQSHISDFNQAFYLCGPGHFSPNVKEALLSLGAREDLIFSEY